MSSEQESKYLPTGLKRAYSTETTSLTLKRKISAESKTSDTIDQLKIKDLVNKYNEILYSVPYQHFTNAIENWFSVLKSRLQKKRRINL